MGFKEVQTLDADVVIALGKRDKKTGKTYPKSAEGYYLGSRVVKNKRGESNIHFLQTEKGNLGLWGTTDMDRKFSQVTPGNMVRVTSTGTKPTPNGDMYTYRLEVDAENTIEVNVSTTLEASEDNSPAADNESSYVEEDEDNSEEETEVEYSAASNVAALSAAERKAKVDALLNRSKAKTK